MRHASLVVFVLGSLSQAVAGSLTFDDRGSGLRIDSHIEGAGVCFLKPVELASPADCEGLDVEAAAGRVPAQASFLAIVRQGGWDFSIALMDQPRPRGSISKAQARDFVRGAKRTATGFAFESDEPDFEVINRLRVFSYAAVSSDRNLPFNAMLQYVVIGEQTISIFSFSSDAQHLPALKGQARQFMKAVTKPGAAGASAWSEGSEAPSPNDRYYEAGKAFGELLGNVLILVAICAGAVLIFRSFRRRGPGATRGP